MRSLSVERAGYEGKLKVNIFLEGYERNERVHVDEVKGFR